MYGWFPRGILLHSVYEQPTEQKPTRENKLEKCPRSWKTTGCCSLLVETFPYGGNMWDWEFLLYQWNDGMLRHFECFPLVWEILLRHNVPVEHLPLERVRRRVYCNVSVLESWRNEIEAGRRRTQRRRRKKKKSWREKDKRVRVVNGAREAMRGKIEMMWKKEAEGGGWGSEMLESS